MEQIKTGMLPATPVMRNNVDFLCLFVFKIGAYRGLIYKTLHDKYMTMLRHAEGVRQMYHKTQCTKNLKTKFPQKL